MGRGRSELFGTKAKVSRAKQRSENTSSEEKRGQGSACGYTILADFINHSEEGWHCGTVG